MTHTGRGGAGNFRSPSEDRFKPTEAHPQTASILLDYEQRIANYEKDVIKTSQEAKQASAVSCNDDTEEIRGVYRLELVFLSS